MTLNFKSLLIPDSKEGAKQNFICKIKQLHWSLENKADYALCLQPPVKMWEHLSEDLHVSFVTSQSIGFQCCVYWKSF